MPTEKDLKIAKEIKREIKKTLGDKLISVTLYGSRARGNAKSESDMDLFLLTTKQISDQSPESEAVFNLSLKYLDKYGLSINPILYSRYKYQRYHKYLPVLHWIDKEGIKL